MIYLNIHIDVSQRYGESIGVGPSIVMRPTSHNNDAINVCPDTVVCS